MSLRKLLSANWGECHFPSISGFTFDKSFKEENVSTHTPRWPGKERIIGSTYVNMEEGICYTIKFFADIYVRMPFTYFFVHL